MDQVQDKSKANEPRAEGLQSCFDLLTHFGGFDWGMSNHQFAMVDRQGKVLMNLRFADDAEGWASLREAIVHYPQLGVAIETSTGPAVERLLELGVVLYPMNPKSAERYRDRKSPSGVKSDFLDAWCFADALRTDGHGWRQLRTSDPLTAELRILCRDQIGLIEQRTALVLQLKAALHEYYPVALQAFDDWTRQGAWEFVLAFPDPHRLLSASKHKWEKFLHAHDSTELVEVKLYRPETAAKRLELFKKAKEFASPSQPVTSAKSLLAISLAKSLCTLADQLEVYRKRIGELFNNHPDRDCFGSLPGAGEKIAPRLLAELGSDRARFESHEALQMYAGLRRAQSSRTAPMTRQSGKSSVTSIRWLCNKTLRSTVHHWANLSRPTCAWAEAYYQQKKKSGMSHAAALRCLGQRWLKILWKMWQTRTSYDEALHTRNQIKHGSWVIALTKCTAPSTAE